MSTKINVLVDGNDLPICICLAPSQASGKAAVAALIECLPCGRDRVADRGNDAGAIIEQVTAIGARAYPGLPRWQGAAI